MNEDGPIKKLLVISIVAGTIYGGMALLFGLLISYNILLLDGVYTLIGAVMSFISLYIAKFIQLQDFERFPFGKEALMPLVVFIQYSIILLISIYGIIESLFDLFHKQPVNNSPIGLYFSLGGALYCLIFYSYFKRNPLTHPFYQVELEQWRFGFLFSSGVVASFVLSLLVQTSSYSALADYIDPVVSIGITLFFIVLSLTELKRAILELVSSTPKEELRERMLESVEQHLEGQEIETYLLRTAKVGNQIIVELDIVILPNSSLDSVTKQDTIRGTLYRTVKHQIEDHSLWLNVNFVGDIKWAYEVEDTLI